MFGSPHRNTEDAGDDPLAIGRRSAARLRLAVPARLISLYETRSCILIDLSLSGAQIGLERPLRKGESAFLQFARMEQFGFVVRAGRGINGMQFDIPLSRDEILAVRNFAETFHADEQRELRAEVRRWVTGQA